MVESIVGKKLNKGEWAEFYVMLKLLGEGKLYTADKTLKKKIDSYLDILKIIRLYSVSFRLYFQPFFSASLTFSAMDLMTGTVTLFPNCLYK